MWSRQDQRWVVADGEARRNTLAHCCRVSRSFGQLAQAILYRKLNLQDHKESNGSSAMNVEWLVAHLEIREGLGPLVRELSLSLDASQEKSFRTIIGCCTSLRSLDLSLRGSSVEPTAILNSIASAGFALTRLKLDLMFAWSGIDEAVRHLLRSQPGLLDLELGCSSSDWRLVTADAVPPPTFRLRALTLRRFIPKSYLPFLTGHSNESLGSLSLELGGWNRDRADPSLPYDLAPFTNLSSLSLSGDILNPFAQSLFNTISTLPICTVSLNDLYSPDLDVLPLLPPTLETLSIDGSLEKPRLITAWIESGACPSLSRISYERWEVLPSRAFDALQRACRTRGLVLEEVQEAAPEVEGLHYSPVSPFEVDSSGDEDEKRE
ncbi:hypothetical protein RQP46_002837 [Phenoliferia psychrophenolica]